MLTQSTSKSAPARETVSVDAAARRLGVHRLTLYAAVARGEVPAIRIGRRQLIPSAWLDRTLTGDVSGKP